jgi:hypothetical protein
MAKRRSSTTTTDTTTPRKRSWSGGAHEYIRITLDVNTVGTGQVVTQPGHPGLPRTQPGQLADVGQVLGAFPDELQDGIESAGRSGSGVRMVLRVPPSVAGNLKDAIGELPAGFSYSVVSVEKVARA